MYEALIPLPEVLSRRGRSKSRIYKDVAEGLFPEPIHQNGSRRVVWPASEVTAINAAVVAGKSDDEIRELVRSLTAARKAAA